MCQATDWAIHNICSRRILKVILWFHEQICKPSFQVSETSCIKIVLKIRLFFPSCLSLLLLQFSSVQSLNRIQLYATPWITARQASLSHHQLPEWPGEFLFQYPIILPFHTVHGVVKARILKWFVFPFPRGSHSVRPLHHDPPVLGGPTGMA